MARRRIGQEQLAIASSQPRGDTSLDEMSRLVDWVEIDRLLGGVSAAAKGELGWPPLALFRALLLAMWHDLSDVRLAQALDDRASFRRFCGFGSHEPTPERTAFVRFRRVLVRLDLDRVLFEALTRQLDARGVVVRCGTLVDATLLPSASIGHDAEARWGRAQAAQAGARLQGPCGHGPGCSLDPQRGGHDGQRARCGLPGGGAAAGAGRGVWRQRVRERPVRSAHPGPRRHADDRADGGSGVGRRLWSR